jgi:uncharacterized protein (DUF1330 family)
LEGEDMSVYFVAQIRIHDMEEYQKYLDGVDTVFAKFKGEYLAVDENPEVLEGEWGYSRMVIIRFPNEYELKRWYESPEYRKINIHRLAAADGLAMLVKGKDEPVKTD